jgi:hypothetical protein
VVTSQNPVSVAAQEALRDMIEFQMYLVSQSRQTPWPMLPRRAKRRPSDPNLFDRKVESSVAKELIDRWFIDCTSNRTFVVNEAGLQFYEREIRQHSA